jgi:uridine kinase
MTYPGLAARIRRLPPSCGQARVVAVDGPGGSGKTTFADRLTKVLDAQVIHSDDFPVPWEEGPADWFSLVEKQVLTPLSRGEPGRFQRYDWVAESFAEWVNVPRAPVVILEGVSTARRSAPLAFRIWVEAPRLLRLARGIERDGDVYEDQWHTWTRKEDEWFAADGTRAGADLLVDGNPLVPHDPLTEFVTL